jgi:hypothetical protein
MLTGIPGCTCADYGNFYTILGRLVSAETEDPFVDGTIGVRLLNDGREIAYVESALPAIKNDGTFGISVGVGELVGMCSLLGLGSFFVSLPPRPEVDAIEIIVNDGQCRRVISVPVNENTVEVAGIANGVLQLSSPLLVEPCNAETADSIP